MVRTILFAMFLGAGCTLAVAQAPASAPAATSSAPQKGKLFKKLKNHPPGAPAVNPEAQPDKKGGA